MFKFLKTLAIIFLSVRVVTLPAVADSILETDNQLRICPLEEEKDISLLLGIGDLSRVELGELLLTASSRGFSYEVAIEDNELTKCVGVDPIPNMIAYKIYAGFDPTSSFTRNFLVLADQSGVVRYIEARHAFRAPGF